MWTDTTCSAVPSAHSMPKGMRVSGLKGFGKFCPRLPDLRPRGCCCSGCESDCPDADFGVKHQRASTSVSAAQRWYMAAPLTRQDPWYCSCDGWVFDRSRRGVRDERRMFRNDRDLRQSALPHFASSV